MRRRFGFLVIAAALGASLLTPDAALARRCGRHHRNRGCCGVSNCSPCGGTSSYGCGTGCGNGAAAPAPAMSGPPPAPTGESAPPPPAPAPGT
ncbi:MAG TPA: hypothetical protein VG826_10245 [Pirellulales bacterium]|nr:hypothetical protein [Pirellulales bacterium]